MRVCHIITTLVYGGAEMLLLNSCNSILKSNKNVQFLIIFFKGDPVIKKYFDPRIEIIHIPLSLKSVSDIRKRIKKFNPDVIHTHLGHADFLGIWASRKLKNKLFCTMHNIYFKYNFIDKLFFGVYRILFNLVKKVEVISISQSVKNHVENTLKLSKERSYLLYNGITPLDSNDNNRSKLGFDTDDFIILFVGRLSVQKNVSLLIQAAELVSDTIPQLKLVIIGAGPLETNLKQQASSTKIRNKIQFLGTTKTPEKYFNIADLFVLPSIFEGFGLVIVEAFRSKCAVVASNIEGPKELIDNNVNGLLFECGDIHSLTQAIETLYNDPEKKSSIGQNGYNEYFEKYRIEVYNQKLINIYERST